MSMSVKTAIVILVPIHLVHLSVAVMMAIICLLLLLPVTVNKNNLTVKVEG